MKPDSSQFDNVVNLADYRQKAKEIRQQKMRDTPNHSVFYKRKSDIEENLNKVEKQTKLFNWKDEGLD
jgi:hypothetical protein